MVCAPRIQNRYHEEKSGGRCALDPRTGDGGAPELLIELVTGSDAEANTARTLEILAHTRPLARFTFTRRLRIEEGLARPFSHPVLTLNTAAADDADRLLSQYLHEQMHWALTGRGDRTARFALLRELQARYPGLTVAPPEGSGDTISTYFHVAICAMEQDALAVLLGEQGACHIIRRNGLSFYRGIYSLVLKESPRILTLLAVWGGGRFWDRASS